MAIVRVAVDVPLPQLFDYRCDDALPEDIGRRVIVPFGKRRTVGLIADVAEQSELPAERLKSAIAVLRDTPAMPRDWMALTQFCAEYYQRPLGEVIFAALPPRLRRVRPLPNLPRRFELTGAGFSALETIPVRQKTKRRVLEALRAGECEEDKLKKLVHGASKLLDAFAQAGWIRTALPQPRTPQFVTLHALNAEQQEALSAVQDTFGRFSVFLLFGVTGSGKTEVYLNLVAQTLAQGRQALVLVPEISLTPALEEAFRSRFQHAQLVVQHSGAAQIERAHGWLAAQTGGADIVLGTRLAVFVPLQRLGLIVVDEEQDPSFKQQEGLRYSARDLAIFRARQARAPVVLCSATPSLETFHHSLTGRYRALRLTRRAHTAARLPTMRLIDMRGVPAREGLSEPLVAALAARLARGEQSLVFLNRRGYAPSLACYHCGWVCGCPRCSAYLVVHLSARVLRCHHCGHEARIPRSCPQCGNLDLTPMGRGTQRLEATLAERFPKARVLRIDSDSAQKRIAGLLEQARAGEADILVGTQMLAKGHHFERVTLVAVINADAGLFTADYRAPERAFAQLQQVAGRSGRADLPGEVMIQTRFPHHPLYRALERQDYEGYARELLEDRRRAGFPPFLYEAALRADALRMSEAMAFLKQAVDLAPAVRESVTLYDPAPASLARLAGRERAQIIVQSPARQLLQGFLRAWGEALYAQRKIRVRWHFDVDPIEF
jgi:primosomal protein N' (replication factor Y) (superfamily II helicase)